MISLIVTILAGAVIGWLASMIMKSRSGFIVDVICGIVGAFVGSFIAPLLGFRPHGADFSVAGLIFGVIGACIVIAIYKAVTGAGNRVA